MYVVFRVSERIHHRSRRQTEQMHKVFAPIIGRDDADFSIRQIVSAIYAVWQSLVEFRLRSLAMK